MSYTPGEQIYCHKCGRDCQVVVSTDGLTNFVGETYTYTGCYGSSDLDDGVDYTFTLCEKCLAAIFETFIIPPVKRNVQMSDEDLQRLDRYSPNLAKLMRKDKMMQEGLTLRVFFQEAPDGIKRERIFYEVEQAEADVFSFTFKTDVQITRIQFPHHLVHEYEISSIKVGGVEQFLTSGPVPMAPFSELAIGGVAFDRLKAEEPFTVKYRRVTRA